MPLEGLVRRTLTRRPDERGYFAEILRSDWTEFTMGEAPVQANLSMSYPEIVRAWHRHARGQVDYFIVVQGAVKICAYDDRPGSATRGELSELVASADHLAVLRVAARGTTRRSGTRRAGGRTLGIARPTSSGHAVAHPRRLRPERRGACRPA